MITQNLSNQNNSNIENPQEGFPRILLSVYSNDKILYQRYFPNTATFGDLIIDFESNIKDPQIKNKIEYNFKKKKVNKKDRIIDINKVEKNTKLIEIDVSLDFSFSELKIPENANTKLKTNKIFKPQSNPFHIISYSPKEGEITLETYPQKDIIENSLNEFSDSTAYCNSNDALYMSGGEKDGKPTNHFWKINHERKILEHCEMPICKSGHSMIFIPDNYILIAGGNNKDCLLYDIEKKIFIKWGNMNDESIEPALILCDDNTVYSLNNFTGGKKNFEKTDLNSFPIWEKITPKVTSNPFDLRFYSAGKCNDGNIILYGGSEVGKNGKCFLYDIKKNELKNIDVPNEKINIGDKSFYPINKYNSVLIPNDFNQNKELVVLNKNNHTIKKIPFDINQDEQVIQDEIDYKCPNNIANGTFSVVSKIKQIPEIEDVDINGDEIEVTTTTTSQDKLKSKPKTKLSKVKGVANIGEGLKNLLNKLKKNEISGENSIEDNLVNNGDIKEEEVPKKENKYLKIIGDKFKKLIEKHDEDNKWNKLGNLALSNKDKLNRAKVNKDLVILSTPQLSNTRQTELDLPPPENEIKTENIEIAQPNMQLYILLNFKILEN